MAEKKESLQYLSFEKSSLFKYQMLCSIWQNALAFTVRWFES